MSASSHRPLAPPSPLTLDGLVHRLTLVERAANEAARTDFGALKDREGARDVREALRIVERVTRRMGAIKRLLESSSGIQAPQDEVQATFDSELAKGELLESSHFQERAGWTRQALSKAVLAGRLFYLEVAGVRAYPAFYLDLRYNRKDVEAVTKLLGDLSGGSKWLFFTTPKGSLARPKSGSRTGTGSASRVAAPRTPLQALEDGDVELVKRFAAGHAHR